MTFSRLIPGVIGVALLVSPALFSQTILTFDIAGIAPRNPIPPDYGDNVIAPVSGAYSCGSNGFTPDVVVDYGKNCSGTSNSLEWSAGRAKVCPQGCTQATITLTAITCFQVDLLGLDLGTTFGGSLNIHEVRVSNPHTSAPLFVQNNVPFPGGPTRSPSPSRRPSTPRASRSG